MAYDAINAIIGIEKKAQEIIAPASKAQAEFDESLKAEKEKIYAAKNAEYEESISAFKKAGEEEAEKLIKDADKSAAAAKEKLDKMYEQNCGKWLDSLFKNVLGQV